MPSLVRMDAERFSRRLLIAGGLLVIALPALSGVATVLGYPVAALPPPVIVVLGGLQLLIVLYAAIVVVQLIAAAAAAVPSGTGKGGRGRQATRADDTATGVPTSRSVRSDLRTLACALVEMIWEREQRGRAALEPAILACVRDAVSVEIEHRRRVRELERRRGELEAEITPQGSNHGGVLRRA